MRITHNDTDATSGTNALFIDANYSGSDTFTGDKANAGLYIDLDSSATGGGLTEEHRIYGIRSDVRHSGDSDLVNGIYSYVRSDHASETTTILKAGDFLAVSSGTGTNTNIYGINSYALKDSGSTGTTTNMYGVRGEVEVDAGTCTNAFGFQSHIDQDGGTITNGYLYYGNYAGTVSTKWGIYLTGETKNYFSGNVGIGEANPQAKLHVNGEITNNNPGCRVGQNATQFTVASGAIDVLKYNYVFYDTGSDYSTSTGLFTCPLAGKYLCMHMMTNRSSRTRVNISETKIYWNGTEVSRQFMDTTQDSSVATVIIDASVNDTLNAGIYNANSTNQYNGINEGGGSQFFVHFLG
jgi:hypothetical protein